MKQNKNSYKSLNVLLFGGIVIFFILGLQSCDKPTKPTFDSPYDKQNENFIVAGELATISVSNIKAFQAQSGGRFNSEYGTPVSAKGVCWSTEQQPTVEDTCTNDGSGFEAFNSNITELEPNIEYFLRAYAVNEDTTIYGGQQIFTTLQRFTLTTTFEGNGTVLPDAGEYTDGTIAEIIATPSDGWSFTAWSGDATGNNNPLSLTMSANKSVTATFLQLATLTTTAVSSITATGAQSGGEITDDGGTAITARGVCYATSENPTTADTCTSDGSGTGNFLSSLTGLNSATTYYLRAYATNEAGTAYGEQDVFTTLTEVVEVTNPATGRTWMDRNLGASRAATSSTDEEAFGDLYQWGRATDGHEKRNSNTTPTLSSSDQPSHGEFILAGDATYDWRSPQNDNLWQGVNGINNPCPDGFRLPTELEWEAERNSWSSNDATGAFDSSLNLSLAGRRDWNDGSLEALGSFGNYWSSTPDSDPYTQVRGLGFSDNDGFLYYSPRAAGGSVRCIKD